MEELERLTKHELLEELARLSPADRFEVALTTLASHDLTVLKQTDRLQAAFAVASTGKPKGKCNLPVTPFRERYLILHARDKLTADECASRMGWFYGANNNGIAPKGDGTRFKRRLGLEADVSSGGRYSVSRFVTGDMAAGLCAALDIDPVDAGV